MRGGKEFGAVQGVWDDLKAGEGRDEAKANLLTLTRFRGIRARKAN